MWIQENLDKCAHYLHLFLRLEHKTGDFANGDLSGDASLILQISSEHCFDNINYQNSKLFRSGNIAYLRKHFFEKTKLNKVLKQLGMKWEILISHVQNDWHIW